MTLSKRSEETFRIGVHKKYQLLFLGSVTNCQKLSPPKQQTNKKTYSLLYYLSMFLLLLLWLSCAVVDVQAYEGIISLSSFHFRILYCTSLCPPLPSSVVHCLLYGFINIFWHPFHNPSIILIPHPFFLILILSLPFDFFFLIMSPPLSLPVISSPPLWSYILFSYIFFIL